MCYIAMIVFPSILRSSLYLRIHMGSNIRMVGGGKQMEGRGRGIYEALHWLLPTRTKEFRFRLDMQGWATKLALALRPLMIYWASPLD
jgi:hypothetical protein